MEETQRRVFELVQSLSSVMHSILVGFGKALLTPFAQKCTTHLFIPMHVCEIKHCQFEVRAPSLKPPDARATLNEIPSRSNKSVCVFR